MRAYTELGRCMQSTTSKGDVSQRRPNVSAKALALTAPYLVVATAVIRCVVRGADSPAGRHGRKGDQCSFSCANHDSVSPRVDGCDT